jgi:hypothetical protein
MNEIKITKRQQGRMNRLVEYWSTKYKGMTQRQIKDSPHDLSVVLDQYQQAMRLIKDIHAEYQRGNHKPAPKQSNAD